LARTYVEVGGNVEVVITANPQGTYRLNIPEVAARSRAGAVYLGRDGTQQDVLTDRLRSGEREFTWNFPPAIPKTIFIGTGESVASADAVRTSSVAFSILSASLNPLNVVVAPAPSPQVNADYGGGSQWVDSWLVPLAEIWDEIFGAWGSPKKNRRERRSAEASEPADGSGQSPWSGVWHMLNRILDRPLNTPAEQSGSSPPSSQASPDRRSAEIPRGTFSSNETVSISAVAQPFLPNDSRKVHATNAPPKEDPDSNGSTPSNSDPTVPSETTGSESAG